MDIFEKNKLNIDRRISEGLELLKESYVVKEIDTKEFSNININGLGYVIKQYNIENVGNLVIMTCKDSNILQMDSFVITSYYKDIPLFSTDYIYIKDKRTFLNEIYSLIVNEDELYKEDIEEFNKLKDRFNYLDDMKIKPCWYDNIRPVCIAKNTDIQHDEEIINIFLTSLKLFIQMEKERQFLDKQSYKVKWQKVQDYTDSLVDRGGVSTELFKKVLGEDKTKEFFNKVFFATSLYEI